MKKTYRPKVIKTADYSACNHCKYGEENNNCDDICCDNCVMYNDEGECKCTTIKEGQPCPFFKLLKKGKKNNE